MEDFVWKFEAYSNQTTVHPVGLASLLILAAVSLVVSKKHALLPMLVLVCFVSSAQRIVIVGFDFTFLRLMVIALLIRMLFRGEYKNYKPVALDFVVLAVVFIAILTGTIRIGTSDAFINRLGFSYEALGIYFGFRVYMKDFGDIQRVLTWFAVLSILSLVLFSIEYSSRRNLFAFLGGVPEFTAIRDGKLRCQGPFSHPIIAGVFWVMFVPLFVASAKFKPSKSILFGLGIGACIGLVGTVASSTPVSALITGLIALFFYAVRKQMRLIRWAFLFMLVCLHFMMQAPVWHLMSRVDFTGSSTGWHRYNLINQAVDHFGEWWLIGTPSTLHWGIIDITNEYVLWAIQGGLLNLIGLIVLITFAFVSVGRGLQGTEQNKSAQFLVWSIGCVMFMHITIFTALSYFGQATLSWYMSLAMAACMCITCEVFNIC